MMSPCRAIVVIVPARRHPTTRQRDRGGADPTVVRWHRAASRRRLVVFVSSSSSRPPDSFGNHKNGQDARRRARTRRRGRVCVCASDGRGVAGDARRHEWRAAPGGGAALAARTGGVWGRGLATRERRGAGRARGGWWATHRDPEEVLPFGQRGTCDIMWRNVAYCGVI